MKTMLDRDIESYVSEVQEIQRQSFYKPEGHFKALDEAARNVVIALTRYKAAIRDSTTTEPASDPSLDGRGQAPAFPPLER